MGNTAIEVVGIGKKYQIGGKRRRYNSFRDTLVTSVKAPIKRIGKVIRGEAATGGSQTFWALDDLNFTIQHGEIVGIIGHNGAGKSTLLKILSRITQPTKGYALLYGRVGALLEVGTGFHEELTGRENLYLNGAILGMSRSEITRKFDEIVEFAEVSQFIDTPVKHYSSGMKLRLGFAVAAHLEPEILIVDEVLAVGDMAFQQKCLGKMSAVAGEGRTVLFVSHNMTAISTLTNRAIILKEGRLLLDGATQEVIPQYLSASAHHKTAISWEEGERPGDKRIELLSCQIGMGDHSEFGSHESVPIILKYSVKQPLHNLRLGFELMTHEGVVLFRTYESDRVKSTEVTEPGEYESICHIPPYLLNDGLHFVTIRVTLHSTERPRAAVAILNNLLAFQIHNLSGETTIHQRPGVINPLLEWKTNLLSSEYSK